MLLPFSPRNNLVVSVHIFPFWFAGGDIDRERSFSCRFKCVLNTNAGFYKVRDREIGSWRDGEIDSWRDREIKSWRDRELER